LQEEHVRFLEVMHPHFGYNTPPEPFTVTSEIADYHTPNFFSGTAEMDKRRIKVIQPNRLRGVVHEERVAEIKDFYPLEFSHFLEMSKRVVHHESGHRLHVNKYPSAFEESLGYWNIPEGEKFDQEKHNNAVRLYLLFETVAELSMYVYIDKREGIRRNFRSFWFEEVGGFEELLYKRVGQRYNTYNSLHQACRVLERLAIPEPSEAITHPEFIRIAKPVEEYVSES